MAEIFEPQVLHTKPRRKFKLTDVLVFVILGVLIVALLVTLISKLSLKHEVSAARVVSDRLISDIARHDAHDARSLGDAKFQAKNSDTTLQQLFVSASQVAKGTPKVDRQTVANAAKIDTVYVIYTYAGKTPYYIRVAVSKVAGAKDWHLTGISGSNNEASLIVK